MDLSQKFEVGLALKKESEYMDKKGISVNVVHHTKRNMNISDVAGGGNVWYNSTSVRDLKKIFVKGESISFKSQKRLDVSIITTVQHCPRLESTARQDKDLKW